jgi:hypothetical protein
MRQQVVSYWNTQSIQVSPDNTWRSEEGCDGHGGSGHGIFVDGVAKLVQARKPCLVRAKVMYTSI